MTVQCPDSQWWELSPSLSLPTSWDLGTYQATAPVRGIFFFPAVLGLKPGALSCNQYSITIVSCLDYIPSTVSFKVRDYKSLGQASAGSRIKDAQTNPFSDVMWISFVGISHCLLGTAHLKGRDAVQPGTPALTLPGLEPCPPA